MTLRRPLGHDGTTHLNPIDKDGRRVLMVSLGIVIVAAGLSIRPRGPGLRRSALVCGCDFRLGTALSIGLPKCIARGANLAVELVVLRRRHDQVRDVVEGKVHAAFETFRATAQKHDGFVDLDRIERRIDGNFRGLFDGRAWQRKQPEL